MNRKKILIIDDDRQVSLAISIRLRAADYEVDVAGDGETGLLKLADEIPNAHLVTIAYGAHLVMAESAERFNQTVLQFLSASKRGS